MLFEDVLTFFLLLRSWNTRKAGERRESTDDAHRHDEDTDILPDGIFTGYGKYGP